jgi:hypothetical protein
MNLDAATAAIRLLATAAGVANADAVTITLSPYKGNGERSFMKGAKLATATGWGQHLVTVHGPTRSLFVPSAEGRDEEAAIAALFAKCREWSESALNFAIAEEQRLLDEARKATESVKALNVEARRAAMLAAQ